MRDAQLRANKFGINQPAFRKCNDEGRGWNRCMLAMREILMIFQLCWSLTLGNAGGKKNETDRWYKCGCGDDAVWLNFVWVQWESNKTELRWAIRGHLESSIFFIRQRWMSYECWLCNRISRVSPNCVHMCLHREAVRLKWHRLIVNSAVWFDFSVIHQTCQLAMPLSNLRFRISRRYHLQQHSCLTIIRCEMYRATTENIWFVFAMSPDARISFYVARE